MNSITKDLAQKIVNKLEMDVDAGNNHDLAKCYIGGKLVASFGLRRGSNKKSVSRPHSTAVAYIPSSSPTSCLLSHVDWRVA
jgi:hypothetical protein